MKSKYSNIRFDFNDRYEIEIESKLRQLKRHYHAPLQQSQHVTMVLSALLSNYQLLVIMH